MKDMDLQETKDALWCAQVIANRNPFDLENRIWMRKLEERVNELEAQVGAEAALARFQYLSPWGQPV